MRVVSDLQEGLGIFFNLPLFFFFFFFFFSLHDYFFEKTREKADTTMMSAAIWPLPFIHLPAIYVSKFKCSCGYCFSTKPRLILEPENAMKSSESRKNFMAECQTR